MLWWWMLLPLCYMYTRSLCLKPLASFPIHTSHFEMKVKCFLMPCFCTLRFPNGPAKWNAQLRVKFPTNALSFIVFFVMDWIREERKKEKLQFIIVCSFSLLILCSNSLFFINMYMHINDVFYFLFCCKSCLMWCFLSYV